MAGHKSQTIVLPTFIGFYEYFMLIYIPHS